MSRTITTNGTIGIYLTDPLDNPVKVLASGTISTTNDYAILGSAAVAWTLTNFGKLSGGQYGMNFEGSATIANSGTMVATGTKSTGVLLQGGGSIVNGAAGFPGARNQRQLYWRADHRWCRNRQQPRHDHLVRYAGQRCGSHNAGRYCH